GEQQPKGDQGKDTKPSVPKAPESPKMPEKPQAPEKAPAPKAPKASEQSASPKAPAPQSTPSKKAVLPATGEASHPFFSLAALSVIASAGLLTLKRKKS
ncbi:TPA: LPXTG cell wall anchor domain-containing protein, partial [Streptococcus equi subsp. equi]|nr:LPXTG cell wall anchor domain-containing protein [Streptococcus equi subsp. equi]HEK9956705.1 LPXTG cell wall anchor domain-containing protein [Streptococcus equi subsp. equi]